MSDEFEILDYLEDDLYEDSDEEWEAPEPTVEPIDTVRLGPNTLYYSGFIIKESADGNSIINYSSRFHTNGNAEKDGKIFANKIC